MCTLERRISEKFSDFCAPAPELCPFGAPEVSVKSAILCSLDGKPISCFGLIQIYVSSGSILWQVVNNGTNGAYKPII